MNHARRFAFKQFNDVARAHELSLDDMSSLPTTVDADGNVIAASYQRAPTAIEE